MKNDPQPWIDLILRYDLVGFFEQPVFLSSHRTSSYYINWRKAAEDPYILEETVNLLLSYIRNLNLNPDIFYGVPEGASKLALATQMKWAKQSPGYGPGSHILSMGRGKAKNHGAQKDRAFLGTPSGSVVVLEDVTTTGGSLLRAVESLSDCEIIAAITLTDRGDPEDQDYVAKTLSAKGIPFFPMCYGKDVLPQAIQKLNPSSTILKRLENE